MRLEAWGLHGALRFRVPVRCAAGGIFFARRKFVPAASHGSAEIKDECLPGVGRGEDDRKPGRADPPPRALWLDLGCQGGLPCKNGHATLLIPSYQISNRIPKYPPKGQGR